MNTGETVLALAYHKNGDEVSRDKQLAVVRKLITQLEESPPEPTSGLAPWAVAFGIEMTRRELAAIEMNFAPQ